MLQAGYQAYREQELKTADHQLHEYVVSVLVSCILRHAFQHVEQVEQPAGQAE